MIELTELYGNLLSTPPPEVETTPPPPIVNPIIIETKSTCPPVQTSTSQPLIRNLLELITFALVGAFIIFAMDIISNMRR
jgi:hypothetical protein